MATGIVSTARITHATPASAFAHVTNRNWEADVGVAYAARNEGCKDIAHQLIMENNDILVILGGGRENFLPRTVADPATGTLNNVRQDGLNLIDAILRGLEGEQCLAEVVCDFEVAIWKGVQYMFDDVRVRGCSFH